jgi:hypothetical protein
MGDSKSGRSHHHHNPENNSEKSGCASAFAFFPCVNSRAYDRVFRHVLKIHYESFKGSGFYHQLYTFYRASGITKIAAHPVGVRG